MADSDDRDTEGGGEGESVLDQGGKLKKVVEALARLDLVLGDDTTPENFLDRLHTSVLTKEASDGGEGETPPEEPAATTTEETPPALMSLQSRVDAAEQRAAKLERQALTRRIADLKASGRIGPAIEKKLLGSLNTVRLSFDDKGDLAPNDVTARVEAYEDLPKGSAWPSRLSMTGVVEERLPGEDARRKEAEETGEEIGNMALGRKGKK